MMVSTRGRYALRVLTDMAEHRTEGYLPLKEIAERQDISEKYLESIVKSLVRGGVLTGLRGKGGGYRLNGDPDKYTVGEILRLTEGPLSSVSCLEPGAPLCDKMADCRALDMWRGLDKVINDYLDGYTVADLVQAGDGTNDYVI